MDIQKLKEIEAALLKMEDNADGGNLQLEKILHLFSFFFECITENRNVAFASLFSRMVYTSVHFNYNSTLTGLNHYFRRLSEKREDHSFSNKDMEMVINYTSRLKVPAEDLGPEGWLNPDFN